MSKSRKENNEDNLRASNQGIERMKDAAKTANTKAVRAALNAQKKNAGKSERSQPGSVKALNRRVQNMAIQEKKKAHQALQIANLALKHSARFFQHTELASPAKKQKNQSTPVVHRLRHGRNK